MDLAVCFLSSVCDTVHMKLFKPQMQPPPAHRMFAACSDLSASDALLGPVIPDEMRFQVNWARADERDSEMTKLFRIQIRIKQEQTAVVVCWQMMVCIQDVTPIE
ncbi:uncharacterized protein V6R79_012921 [Siganus canaliculatus]